MKKILSRVSDVVGSKLFVVASILSAVTVLGTTASFAADPTDAAGMFTASADAIAMVAIISVTIVAIAVTSVGFYALRRGRNVVKFG